RTNRNTNVTPTCSSHPMTVAMLIAPPGEPGTEYAAIGPARSRARALASARQPLPRHLDEGLVRQRWRGARSEERRVGQDRRSGDWSSDVCSSDLRTNRNTNVTPTCSSHPMTVAMLIAPPGEPGTEYAAIGPARSRARALASARQPLPRHLDEGLVRQRWRGA